MIASRRARSGKTLVEMLVVIVAMSAVLSTAGQMLYRLSRSERAVRESSAIARAEMRLARSFRADARAATSVEPIGEPNTAGLRFATGAGSVTYHVIDDEVRRTVEHQSESRRDAYRLGDVAVAFAVEDDRVAVIRVEPRRQAGRAVRADARPIEIAAAIGADAVGDRSGITDSLRPGNELPVEASRPNAEESR